MSETLAWMNVHLVVVVPAILSRDSSSSGDRRMLCNIYELKQVGSLEQSSPFTSPARIEVKWNEFIIRQRQTVVTESHPAPRDHFSIVISPSPPPYHRKYSWVTITQQEAETNGLHGWLDRQTDIRICYRKFIVIFLVVILSIGCWLFLPVSWQ